MPDSALRRTEHEFRSLLQDETDRSGAFTLRCFTQHHHAQLNPAVAEPIDALWDAQPDGLIITGSEPKADSITDEPLLPLLHKLVAWGAKNTKSVMFSCFAAHAAVWCLDQIPRQRLPRKLSGVFDCQKSADHPITAYLPERWLTPHSRYNTLNEQALRDAGYLVLSRAPRLGPDMFLKKCGNSEFLFVQGHPEYGAEVLLSEYRRDLKHFEAGLIAHGPHWPDNYRDSEHVWYNSAARMMQGWKSLLGIKHQHIGAS
jgi:homoserine O-succinyltransferase